MLLSIAKPNGSQRWETESLLRVFFNTRLARSYRVLGHQVELNLYHERREVYECHKAGAEIPQGVRILTAAVDVADRSLAYEVVGWGANRESWGIETGEFPGDVGDQSNQVWEQIDRFVFRRVFRYTDGKLIRVRLLFVDSGDHHTSQVYKFCKSRQPRCFATKGLGGPGRAMIVGGKVRERHEGAWLLKLGVDELKDDTFSRLEIGEPGPGFCHFPKAENGQPIQGYGEEYFEELTAEQRVLRYNRGGVARYEYHKDRMVPNEALDLRAYNRAALEYLRVRLFAAPVGDLTVQGESSAEARRTVMDMFPGAVVTGVHRVAPSRAIHLERGDRLWEAITADRLSARIPE